MTTKRVTIRKSGTGYIISKGGKPVDTAGSKADAVETARQWKPTSYDRQKRTGSKKRQ